jgi:hypothetical protein
MGMMTWSSRNPNAKSKSPLLGVPNVEVVYDISPGTTIRVAHGGSLMEGLRLSTLKQDGYSGLCGLDRQSVISYVYREDYCIIVSCVWCYSSLELNLSKVQVKRACLISVSARSFYSSRPDSYIET